MKCILPPGDEGGCISRATVDIDINNSKKYYVLGSFKIIPENIEIKKIRDGSQKTTSHLARDSMRDYIYKSLNMYWPAIKDD